jgi:hypothetical protein
MKFTISHTRALAGNDISVTVDADGGKAIQSVLTKLDGFTIAEDQLSAPSDLYERTFSGVGTAGIGAEHTLSVSATLEDGRVHSSTSMWTDAA